MGWVGCVNVRVRGGFCGAGAIGGAGSVGGVEGRVCGVVWIGVCVVGCGEVWEVFCNRFVPCLEVSCNVVLWRRVQLWCWLGVACWVRIQLHQQGSVQNI